MKKGQAALEFLMTYGWAILLVLIVVGTLSYFDLFSIKDRMPEQIMSPPPLFSEDFTVDNGNISILMRNDLGINIEILNTGYSGTDECLNPDFYYNQTFVDSSDEFVLSFNCPGLVDRRGHLFLTFTYRNLENNIVHNHTSYVVVNG